MLCLFRACQRGKHNPYICIFTMYNRYCNFPFCFVLQDVINKRRADAILDLNVEKSHVKELVSSVK